MIGFWTSVILAAILIAALPGWPHARPWGYWSYWIAATAATVLVCWLLLIWAGWVLFVWPWEAPPA